MEQGEHGLYYRHPRPPVSAKWKAGQVESEPIAGHSHPIFAQHEVQQVYSESARRRVDLYQKQCITNQSWCNQRSHDDCSCLLPTREGIEQEARENVGGKIFLNKFLPPT